MASPVRMQQFQISHQELLEFALVPTEKTYYQIGVGDSLAIESTVLSSPVMAANTKSIVKKVDAGTNCDRKVLKNQCVGETL